MLRNTTVSHVSPTMSYIPGMLWFEGMADDLSLDDYSTKSYHATNGTQGQGSVSFHWTGEGEVWVYGGYRDRLGSYQVKLDHENSSYPGFKEGDQEDCNAVLFSTSGLLPGPHQVELVNTGQDPQHCVLDIAYIVFQSSLGEQTRIEDTDTGCWWFPENSNGTNAWQVNTVSHTTFDSQGGMQLNFSGIGIELWGATGPSNSPFSITLDDWTAQAFSSNTHVPPTDNTSQLLYFNYNLPDGDHSLVIRNNPMWSNMTGVPTTLDIDYSLVYSQMDADNGSSTPAMTHKRMLTIILSSTIGGIFLLVLLLSAWFWCHRRRTFIKKKNTLLRPEPFGIIRIPDSPDNYIHKSSVPDFGAPLSQQQSISSSILRALPTLKIGWRSNIRRGKGKRQKVDHSPNSSIDLGNEGKDELGDNIPAYSILPNAPSSPPPEAPPPARSRPTKLDLERGHGRSGSGYNHTPSPSISILDPNVVLDITGSSFASSQSSITFNPDSPVDPTLPSVRASMNVSIFPGSPPSRQAFTPSPSLLYNNRQTPTPTITPPSTTTQSVDPAAAFAAVKANDTDATESPLSPGSTRRRPLPIPNAIRVGLPMRDGAGRTPPSSRPPPYQLIYA